MKILEFENTQGINLQYSIATSGERVVAYIIDFFVMVITILLFSLIGSVMDISETALAVFCILPPLLLYIPLMEIFNDGRTLGKMAVGLRVVRIDGRPVNVYDYLMRYFFRFLDIAFGFGAIAILTISASPRGQRIGDLLADTTVIQTKQGRVSLKRILSLGKLKSHEAKYPQVATLSEEQVVYVKKVLDESRGSKNQAHADLLQMLASRIRSTLQIEGETDDKKLLETVIKDFVALSR